MEQIKENFCWVRAVPATESPPAQEHTPGTGNDHPGPAVRSVIPESLASKFKQARVEFNWIDNPQARAQMLVPVTLTNHVPPHPHPSQAPSLVSGSAQGHVPAPALSKPGEPEMVDNHTVPPPPVPHRSSGEQVENHAVPPPPVPHRPYDERVGNHPPPPPTPHRILTGASLMTTLHFEELPFTSLPMRIEAVPIFGSRTTALDWLATSAGEAFCKGAAGLSLMCFSVVGDF